MRDFKLLKLLDKIQFIFKPFDIDYVQLRSILQLKLTLDTRNTSSFVNYSQRDTQDKNMFYQLLLSYIIVAIVTGIIFLGPLPFEMKITFTLGMSFVFITFTLISQFSNLLLDVREKNFLWIKPVSNIILSIAKTIHVAYYSFILILVLNSLVLIIGLFQYGIVFTILYILQLILITIMCIFIAGLSYSVLLKLFDGEKLKDIINIFQVVLVMLMLSFNLLMQNSMEISETLVITIKDWTYFLPIFWFNSWYKIILEHHHELIIILSMIISLLIPILNIYIYIKILGPILEDNLIKLNTTNKSKINNKRSKKNIRSRKRYELITRNQTETAFYFFCNNMLKSDRKIKLATYPLFGFVLFFPLSYYFQGTNVHNIRFFLFPIYLTLAMISSISHNGLMSEYPKASWLYKLYPIDNLIIFKKAYFKSIIIKFILPICILLTIILTLFFKDVGVIQILIILPNFLILSLASYSLIVGEIPFSSDKQVKENFIASFFLSIFITSVLGVIHGFIIYNTISIIITSFITSLIAIIWFKILFKNKQKSKI